MPRIMVDIPSSLKEALDKENKRSNSTLSAIISAALSHYLNTESHSVFQVSTSGALVSGVYSGAVTVSTILDHGDFGLGTFAGLDGEMVVLDGVVYQVLGSGDVRAAAADAQAPYAVVTRFSPQQNRLLDHIDSFEALEACCDALRVSDNIFFAFRIEGEFSAVRTRVVNPPAAGTRLVDASRAQSEFMFENVRGTLVGIWSPGFTDAFSVPGYHFHFLSDDRQHGGHLLECQSAGELTLQVEALSHLHLDLPETEGFLQADLSKDNSEELAIAEKSRKETSHE